VPKQNSNDTGRFRPEIAGLRAVAVLSVVLCHLKIGLFEGGFVGVDIFFVISGYLISRNIMLDLQHKRFSFLNFYMRRARRILPALIFTVVLTYICGALWLPPDFFRGLAKESTHALLSIANIQYWRESKEYFSATADQLPLLHCWSLSLEEQFYIFWPAFLFCAFKTGRLASAIMPAAIASFISSLIALRSDAQAAFFLMPFRIFEFSIGAMVVFAQARVRLSDTAAEGLTLGGLLAIGASILSFDATTPFPGLASLLPSVGTGAAIWGGSRTWTSRLLVNPLARAIGAISYSFYLCHWPMIFFARYIFGPEAMTGMMDAILLALMVVVATGMYRFVERPFRQARTISDPHAQRNGALRYAGTVLLLVAITHTTFLQDGWAWRLSEEQAQLTSLQVFGMKPCEEVARRHCAFGKLNGPLGVELVGDSYIHQYVAALDPLLKELGTRGETSTLGGCPILIGMLFKGSRLEECRSTREAVFARLKSTTVSVILGQAWEVYTDSATISEFELADRPSGVERSLAQLEASLKKTIEFLATGGRRILIVGAQVKTNCQIDRARLLPGPLWHAPQKPCQTISREWIVKSGADINAMLARVQAKWPNQVSLMLPADYFCDEQCPIIRNGLWLYEEGGGHFTVAGAQYMGERAQTVFRTFLSE
jgi:peptidoglycan/LPS O-acetylase OafA/YrhL